MKDGQTGRRLCNCFPKEAGACPGGAFFSDGLGAENTPTCLSQIIKSGRWTEGGSKIVSGDCDSFYFVCSEGLLY